MFANITGGLNNKLDRTKFRDILHISFNMTDDILMDRGWLFAKLFNLICCIIIYLKPCTKGFVFWFYMNNAHNVIFPPELQIFNKIQQYTIAVSVFRAFDQDSDNYLTHEEWVLGLSTFLKGAQDDKIKCKSPFISLNVYIHQDSYQS